MGCVLSGEEIRKLVEEKGLIRSYIDLDTQIQPNGFDCTLRSVYRIRGVGKIDFSNRERLIPEIEEMEFEEDWIFLDRGVYRARLNEVVDLPKDIMAIGRPRSSVIRCGANILTAVWDAGYRGRSEVGIVVYNGLWLRRNARIIQLVFIKLSRESEGYIGTYQNEGCDTI